MLSLISQIISVIAGGIIIIFGFIMLWFWIYEKKVRDLNYNDEWEEEDGDDL